MIIKKLIPLLIASLIDKNLKRIMYSNLLYNLIRERNTVAITFCFIKAAPNMEPLHSFYLVPIFCLVFGLSLKILSLYISHLLKNILNDEKTFHS